MDFISHNLYFMFFLTFHHIFPYLYWADEITSHITYIHISILDNKVKTKQKKPRLGHSGIMEISLWNHICDMFVPFLTAPEGSTVCTHAVNCMPLWPAPLKSIHCYSSPPSMSLCLSERYMFWLMISDALWGTSAMKTWTMNHQGRQHKNTPDTALFTFLSIVFPFFFIPFVCLSHFSFVPLLIWMAWLFWDHDVFRHLWRWERRGGRNTVGCSLCD